MRTLQNIGSASRRGWAAAFLLGALLFFPFPSAEAVPELSDRTREGLLACNELIASADWNEAEAQLDRLLAAAAPGSYDAAMVQLHRAQVLLSRYDDGRGDAAAAIPILEQVITSRFWTTDRTLEWRYVLAQLYAQEGRLADAGQAIESWLADTPAPTPAAYVLLGGVELEQMSQGHDDVNTERLEHLLRRMNEGLRLGVRPDPTLLYLKAACLQGLQRWNEAAETLEFILRDDPAQRERWEQLHGMYLAAGRMLPALLALERGREHGALLSPQADLVRGQLYSSLGQNERAIDALEAGLRRGVAESASHWIFAAFLAYQSHDLTRAAGLLAAAEPALTEDRQRRDFASLRAAITAAQEEWGAVVR